MDYLISFDFDGTLYPFCPCDSECWTLAVLCGLDMGKGPANPDQEEVSCFIADAMAGKISRDGFASMIARRTIGSPIKAFDRSTDILIDLALSRDPGLRDSIASLKAKGVHLAINSCGSDYIITLFLKKLGLLDLFTFIDARRFLVKDDRIISIEPIWLESSVKAVNLQRRRLELGSPCCISIGDGFTDKAFLEASDKGFLVNWGSGNKGLDYPRFDNISSACSAARALMGSLAD